MNYHTNFILTFIVRIFVFFLVSHSVQCYGQEIKGGVTDKKGTVIPYVNIISLSVDSVFLGGTVSREDGSFSIKHGIQKIGMLRLSSIGYRSRIVPYYQDDFGTIIMQEDTAMLEEITVKRNRPMHQMTEDGLVTNVSGTILGKLGTVNDVLKFVPGLRKTDKGYEVFGKGEPIIFLNGKKVTNPTEINQLSAESIRNITLVSTPGVEYDASVGAVIKIKTLPKAGDGFGGSYRQEIGIAHYLVHKEQLNWNYRVKGLDLFGVLDYSQTGSSQRQNGSQNINLATPRRIDETLSIYSKGRYVNGSIGFNYDMGGNHFFGGTYTIDTPLHTGGTWASSIDVSMADIMTEQLINYFSTQTKSVPNHDIKAYYKGTLGKVQIDWNGEIYLPEKKNYQQSFEAYKQSSDERVVSTGYNSKSRFYATRITSILPF